MKIAPFLILILGLIIILLYVGKQLQFTRFKPSMRPQPSKAITVPDRYSPPAEMPRAPQMPIVAVYPIANYIRPERGYNKRYLHGCQ
jgi:hypothetical protein